MKTNVWSTAEFYLLLGMLVFCAILVWQFSIITVSESRIFPSVILAVSISAAAIQAVHVFGKGDFLDVHKALLTGREWLALLVYWHLISAMTVWAFTQPSFWFWWRFPFWCRRNSLPRLWYPLWFLTSFF